ncbi:MAG TPA: class IV adenylate cyclase [Candidatus Dormibacteraeota bacterium]|nr:class IV adenylate cyclase [Candidatus Dormibacteraeota bacterium]
MPRGRRIRPLRDRTIESELKFRVSGPVDHAKLRAVLRKRGAKLVGHYKEENYRFNGPGKSTRNTTLRLRVLDGGPRGFLTAKGPATFQGGVKSREETEVEVADAHATLDLLQQLGFRVGWSYPKQRAMWRLDEIAITLDVLEYGWFVELEGPETALPDMARSLGLDIHRALRDSYSVMARKFLKTHKANHIAPVTKVSPPPEAPATQTVGASS